VQDAVQAPICATFTDYLATLPVWERGLIKYNLESCFPDTSLCELLKQKNDNILAASDGDHKDDYGSFDWVIGTEQEIIFQCEGIARGYPMDSYRAKGYGRMFLLLFLTHYICYTGG
jgi:hypothetical protein